MSIKPIEIEIDEEIFLPCYRHLREDDSFIRFLWGGRDSGKSHDVAMRKIVECLSAPYFREILVKKTSNSIKDAQWQTIKDIVADWGIDHLFHFTTHPLEITCVNGNKFIARGCDDPGKLKSIRNPSGAWIEEGNQLNESDWIILLTTLRSDKGKVQIDVSLNPETEDVDYEDFYLYKNFFKEHIEKGEYNFRDSYTMTLPDKSVVRMTYSSTHTTYRDNPHCTPERIAMHESLKETNPYFYTIFTLGKWGRRTKGGEFYKCYSAEKHEVDIKLMPGFANASMLFPYNPDLALHMAWDFNVNPYVTCNIWQGKGKWAGKIAEILLEHPRNTNMAVCDEFERMFPNHKAGLFIYGDPGGLKQSTADETTVRVKEKDYSEFTKILTYLKKYRPELRVPRVYPPVKLRGQFINTIMQGGYNDIDLQFDIRCKRSAAEYANLKEDSDGTKFKEMYENENTGVRCQKWGHISDADDYFITQYFYDDFIKYQTSGVAPTIKSGKNVSRNTW